MKSILKKILPRGVIRAYHWFLAQFGALIYGYPARKLIVVGVTGTKGKSTTSYLIAKFLESAGHKVGLSSTIIFKVAEKEWLNDKKMTMLGRFGLQKLLKQMVAAGCKYAVVETSSEGIEQFRHLGIDYDLAVFTNLSPEHIESHGSYDKYRAAKGKLFRSLYYSRKKGVPKTAIVNLDDAEADYFLSFNENNIGFTLRGAYRARAKEILSAKNVVVGEGGSSFAVDGVDFQTKLLGEFNVYNLLGAIAVCKNLGVPLEQLKTAAKGVSNVPGRMEFIREGQNFAVIVDYAHEPASMKALYGIVREMRHNRVIHIFGAAGGGRDRARRPILGEIADQNAQIVILTDDDPYGEKENDIIADVRQGIQKKKENESLFIVPDRRAAINLGIGFANEGDVVLITGKGCEQKMAIHGKLIAWDDREAAREGIKGRRL
jgi:UDP-N-acetylmuramoyl-L-alanyl-D-glutamate--2,6-diaminopimelate ligase